MQLFNVLLMMDLLPLLPACPEPDYTGEDINLIIDMSDKPLEVEVYYLAEGGCVFYRRT